MTAEEGRPLPGAADANGDAYRASLVDRTDNSAVLTLVRSSATGDLLPHHQKLLLSSGIPLDYALRRGVRSVTAVADLPPALKWTAAHDSLPGLLFPWHSPTGEINYQLRPDVPIQLGDDPEPRKYVQETGVQLLDVIGDPHTAREVWLVEGTRQCLAAGCYAPGGVLVLGIPGCTTGYE